MYFVYILRCSDNSLYIGYTANVEVRLKAHNMGLAATPVVRIQPPCALTRECGWPRGRFKGAMMYWLPNPLLPFIWFRVAVPRSHPEIEVRETRTP